jgi:hypothetical protein
LDLSAAAGTRLTLDDFTEEFVGRMTLVFVPGIHATHPLHANGAYSVWDFKKWERL